jgi:uncharacterized protein (DUF1800 family)
MTWFWMNHFNVSTRKGDVRLWVGDYEEQAIRPHALGKFRELLTASMRHPAMLLYLDNASNAAGRINENYARELLELHTMGVGSGYTQADVQAMAHVLTGVGFSTREADARRPSCAPNARATTFAMASSNSTPIATTTRPRSCSAGRWKKRPGPGQRGGRPHSGFASHCALHSTQALRLFSWRQAAPAVVERTAQAFERSHGDIAATLAALLSDPQAQQFGQGFKDPVHYVLGATRLAYDQRVASDVGPVQNWLNQLGQPLYGHETPDGYP